jgi:hypothetical protein
VPPAPGCPRAGPPSSEGTEAICRVPSGDFTQAPRYTLPAHLCRFRVRTYGRLFPGTASPPLQSDKEKRLTRSVTHPRPRNINRVTIDYALRPRLRLRLTLRGLALRRNPWAFGGRASHSPYRYSCQHSHFRYLHGRSPFRFTGLRNAPLPRLAASKASARVLSPVTSSPQDLLFRPVSCYAFFKGWLLLSQPPGCFGNPTCFPT